MKECELIDVELAKDGSIRFIGREGYSNLSAGRESSIMRSRWSISLDPATNAQTLNFCRNGQVFTEISGKWAYYREHPIELGDVPFLIAQERAENMNKDCSGLVDWPEKQALQGEQTSLACISLRPEDFGHRYPIMGAVDHVGLQWVMRTGPTDAICLVRGEEMRQLVRLQFK